MWRETSTPTSKYNVYVPDELVRKGFALAMLDVEGMKKLLLKLRFIREDLGMEEKAKSAEIKSE